MPSQCFQDEFDLEDDCPTPGFIVEDSFARLVEKLEVKVDVVRQSWFEITFAQRSMRGGEQRVQGDFHASGYTCTGCGAEALAVSDPGTRFDRDAARANIRDASGRSGPAFNSSATIKGMPPILSAVWENELWVVPIIPTVRASKSRSMSPSQTPSRSWRGAHRLGADTINRGKV